MATGTLWACHSSYSVLWKRNLAVWLTKKGGRMLWGYFQVCAREVEGKEVDGAAGRK